MENLWIYAVVAMLPFITNVADGQILGVEAEGCGDKADLISLRCPTSGNKVNAIKIISIFTTVKQSCPQSGNREGCDNSVSLTDPFYIRAVSDCQNQVSCYVQAQYISIPVCAKVYAHGNYIRITYNCIPNGVTVPTTPTTTTKTTTTARATTKSTTSTIKPPAVTTATQNTINGNSTADQSNIRQDEKGGGFRPDIAVPIIILLILVAFVVVSVILYRKRKLPHSLQDKMEENIFHLRLRSSDVRTNLQNKMNGLRVRIGKKDSSQERNSDHDSSKFQKQSQEEDEEIYASVDEEYMSYNEMPIQSAGSEKLPAILTIPDTNNSVQATSARITVYEESDADHDDVGWGESEFEDDDEEYTIPAEHEDCKRYSMQHKTFDDQQKTAPLSSGAASHPNSIGAYQRPVNTETNANSVTYAKYKVDNGIENAAFIEDDVYYSASTSNEAHAESKSAKDGDEMYDVALPV